MNHLILRGEKQWNEKDIKKTRRRTKKTELQKNLHIVKSIKPM